jgi:AbrB family looped-hinge helix DNA binding protein
MKHERRISVVTERGQVSVPAELRRGLGLRPGTRLLWEKVSDQEMRVRTLAARNPAGAMAVLGFARRIRREPRRTRDWMAELRAGER